MLETLIEFHEKRLSLAQSVLDADGSLFTDQQKSAARIDAAQHRTFLETLRSAQAELAGDYALWMHAKRGSVYQEVGTLIVQTDTPVVDNDELVLYRDNRSGRWFGRLPEEFRDGRFLPVVQAEAIEDAEVIQTGENTFLVVEDDLPEAGRKLLSDQGLHPEDVQVQIITGEDDDRHWFFSRRGWIHLRTDRQFEVGPEETDDEDMWGRWKVLDIQPPAEQGGRWRVRVKRF